VKGGQAAGSSDGIVRPRGVALIASTRKSRIDRPCARRLSQTVSIRSTKSDPARLAEPLNFATYRDAHRGETFIVCGCGQSLNLLESPGSFVTIGVNDVGRHFTPDYLVVLNPPSHFKLGRFRYVEESRARAIFTQLDRLDVPHSNVVQFRLGARAGTDFAVPDVLHYAGNSPYVAVCLAVHMGARRIGLLGVDFTDHHFFGSTGTHPLAGDLEKIDREYAGLHAACASAGIELVNLSPVSRLTSLPRVDLRSFDARARSKEVTQRPPPPAGTRVFFVNYRFLSCGDVFATGLVNAANALGFEHASTWWDDASLPEKVRAFDPDLVFAVHGKRFVRRWGNALSAWNQAVWLLDEPYEVDDTSTWSSTFRTVFVNDPATIARHRNAHLLPVGFDAAVHVPGSAPREYRMGFVGGHNPVRERVLERLAREKLVSYVVGGPWKSPAVRALCLADRTSPAETTRLYQRTRLVLNVFRSVHHFNHEGVKGTTLNPRVYEALACGALVASEPRPALAEEFPELPTFRDDNEAVDVVRSLLADTARTDRLLAACRARLAGHSLTERLRRAVEIALGAGAAPQIATGERSRR